MARKKPTSSTKKSKLIAEQAVALAEYAGTAFVASEQLRIKTKAIERLPRARQRLGADLLGVPSCRTNETVPSVLPSPYVAR
jgi:hypothetical protein